MTKIENATVAAVLVFEAFREQRQRRRRRIAAVTALILATVLLLAGLAHAGNCWARWYGGHLYHCWKWPDGVIQCQPGPCPR